MSATLLFYSSGFIVTAPAKRWEQQLLPSACDRVVVHVSGTMLGLPAVYGEGASQRQRLTIAVHSLSPSSCAGPSRIRVYAPMTLRVQAGDRLQFDARLRRPHGLVNPFKAEGERRFLLERMHALGSLRGVATLSYPAQLPVTARVDRKREAISSWIRGSIADEVGALLAALAVGDRRYITQQQWESLQRYGLTHLLVISGLHITLFALPGWWLGGALVRAVGCVPRMEAHARFLPSVLAGAFALSYGVLAGFALPVMRAFIMLVLAVVPGWLGRPLLPAQLLSACALVLFFIDPLSLLGSSYWLSLGAVGLLLLVSSWRSAFSWLREMGLAQGLMLLWMVPIGLFWFQSAGTVGGIINLVAIPMVSYGVVMPLLLAVLLHAAGDSASDSASALLLELAGTVLRLLWHAMVYWEPWLRSMGTLHGVLGLGALVLCLLAGVMLILPGFRGRVALAGLFALPLGLRHMPATDDNLRIRFLDMGQGTAVLVTHGQRSLLYDTGGGPPGGSPIARRTLVPQLYADGINTLDWLLISHPDRDHDAGFELIETRFGAQRRLFGRGPPGSQDLEQCRLGARYRFSRSVELRILSSARDTDTDNNASCVALISAFGRQILLPGDIDAQRERELLAYWGKQIQSDVLLAAHHGSGSSSSLLWLRSVDPALVIITAARANRFGHPSPAVVERVHGVGAMPLNTADRGALTLIVKPDGSMQCLSSRHYGRAFWRRSENVKACL